jgi:chromosome segregation ATPase
MYEIKHAVETQAGTLRQLTDSHAELDEGETASEILKAVIEIVSTLARQCSDSDQVVHEKVLALDGVIKFLVSRSELAEKRFAVIAGLETGAKAAAAETQRLSSMVADIFSQLHQLQTKVAGWQAESSNEALNNKLDALSARLTLIETRTECLSEIRSDARRSSGTLSTMVEDIRLLFTQSDAASKQLNSTMARLEGFRRHFEQLPD